MDDPSDCSGPPAAEDSHGHDLRHCAWCLASAPSACVRWPKRGLFTYNSRNSYKGVGWAFKLLTWPAAPQSCAAARIVSGSVSGVALARSRRFRSLRARRVAPFSRSGGVGGAHAVRGRVRRFGKYLKMRANASRVCSDMFPRLAAYLDRFGVARPDPSRRRGGAGAHAGGRDSRLSDAAGRRRTLNR